MVVRLQSLVRGFLQRQKYKIVISNMQIANGIYFRREEIFETLKAIRRVPGTKDIGRMTLNLVKVKKHGQRDPSMSDSTSKERSRDTELTPGLMALFIRVIGLIIVLTVLDTTSGRTIDNTMVTGTTMTCTVWVSTFTRMV